ncbi:MAG: hypothetical protein JKY45_07060 [Emcibacter sp.]|nr:hypothetical protein [Emcibacter sp.]
MYRAIIPALLAFLLGTFSETLLAQEIKLPEGLGDLSIMVAEESEEQGVPFDLSGFLESRIGARLGSDAHQKDMSIGEMRFQVGIEKEFDSLTFNFVSDFIYDPVQGKHAVNLETGQGFMDIREANLTFSPLDFMDVKVGRQVLTWGTGDLLFINDLFAKDWNSFFIGRDDEYLKGPSDALKMAFFFGDYNLDVVYVPRFDADRFIDGTRISFFDRASSDLSGRKNPVFVDRLDRWFEDDELALRFYGAFGAYETALYYYNGYWKSPAGQNITTGRGTFPRLQVFGSSIRGPVSKGIGSLEIGYYKSSDGAGSNPLVRNSEIRMSVGYEQEIGSEFTGGIQYYVEHRLDYDQYLAALPNGALQDRQNRHLFTLRVTKLLMQQDLKISLFDFYSPSDKDGYLRLNISYKILDTLKVELGGNIFYGQKVYSFFGQFQDNSNIYTAIHYDF